MQGSSKRLKESLNLSDTCDQLSQILLRLQSENDSRSDSASTYDVEENVGESSIMEPLCSNVSIEEKFGESSIIEPSRSEISIEEKFGESSIIERSRSECSESCLNFSGPTRRGNTEEPRSQESCEEPLLEPVELNLTFDDSEVEREREAPVDEYEDMFEAIYYTEGEEEERQSFEEEFEDQGNVSYPEVERLQPMPGSEFLIDETEGSWHSVGHDANEDRVMHDARVMHYVDDYRIIIDPNGWGDYEASSEGGHQLASSLSVDNEMMDLAFIEEFESDHDSTENDAN